MHPPPSGHFVNAPRRRRWIAVAAMLHLVAWLLAFSGHVHSAGEDLGGSSNDIHFCEVCAAFPSAATPPWQAPLDEPVRRCERVIFIGVSFRDTTPFSLYHSRAPPHC